MTYAVATILIVLPRINWLHLVQFQQ